MSDSIYCPRELAANLVAAAATQRKRAERAETQLAAVLDSGNHRGAVLTLRRQRDVLTAELEEERDKAAGWHDQLNRLHATVAALETQLAAALGACDRVRDAFSYMPALNGAYDNPTYDELRKEVNDALDWCLPAVHAVLTPAEAAEIRAATGQPTEDT